MTNGQGGAYNLPLMVRPCMGRGAEPVKNVSSRFILNKLNRFSGSKIQENGIKDSFNGKNPRAI
jgi:hypothetical protein